MTLKQFLELSTAQQSRVKNDDLTTICKKEGIPYETDNNKSTLITNINNHKQEEEEEAPAEEEENNEDNGGGEEEAPEEEEPPAEEEEEPPAEEPPAEEPPAEEEEELQDEPTAEEEAADTKVEAEKGGGTEVTSENKTPEHNEEHEALVRKLMGGFYTGDIVNYQCHGNLYPHTKGVKVAYADEATLIIELPEYGNLSHTFRPDLQKHLNVDKKYINAMPSELKAVSVE